MGKSGAAFERLVNIMDELREKCPWDRKQTIQSLRKLTIEEVYELVDEIDHNNLIGIKEEIGDILLHIVFYAKIGAEKNAFTIDEAINDLCDKLIERHPHIYSDVKVKDEEEVKQNWEKIKLKSGKKSILQGVPKSLPSVVKAYRIQEKVAQIGFDWEHKDQVWEKVEEEMAELKEAEESQNRLAIEEEFGDLMFSIVNYARAVNIDPETALSKANNKFIKRFKKMEDFARQEKLQLNDMNIEELDQLWDKAKKLHE